MALLPIVRWKCELCMGTQGRRSSSIPQVPGPAFRPWNSVIVPGKSTSVPVSTVYSVRDSKVTGRALENSQSCIFASFSLSPKSPWSSKWCSSWQVWLAGIVAYSFWKRLWLFSPLKSLKPTQTGYAFHSEITFSQKFSHHLPWYSKSWYTNISKEGGGFIQRKADMGPPEVWKQKAVMLFRVMKILEGLEQFI